MKKTTNNLKTMLLAAVVLVMAQGCVPTNPVGGNPTPNNLIGKIKNFHVKSSYWSEYEYNISYNTNGIVNKINSIYLGSNTPFINYVEYEPNKVIIRDSINTTTGYVCFLKAGTVLLDSIYTYSIGNITDRTIIERDANNNILRILSNNIISRDSFVYANNNIISYIEHFPSTGWIGEITRKVELEYDNTKTVKSIVNSYLSLLNTQIFIDIIGISLGNTSQHPISKTNSTTLSGTDYYNIPVTNYRYTTYNNNLVEFYITQNYPTQNDTIFFSNKYY